jgi:hypothetical protein
MSQLVYLILGSRVTDSTTTWGQREGILKKESKKRTLIGLENWVKWPITAL